MSRDATTNQVIFIDAEHARSWLMERLDRLEEAVRDGADLYHTATSLTAEAMAQLEGDPMAFRKMAVIHMRDAEAAVGEIASARASREGFNVSVLERLTLEAVGTDPAHGRAILEGLASALRDRIVDLSGLGSAAHDEGLIHLDEALLGLDRGLQRVVQRWETHAPGLFNRWRRRRRLRKQGLEHVAGLPELVLGLADAAREHRPAFEAAWEHTIQGATSLGLTRSLGSVLDWIANVLTGLDGLAGQAASVGEAAARRLARLDGAWRGEVQPDRPNLLTVELLDRILDGVGLDAQGFIGRADVRARDLARLGKQGFETELKRWVEDEVGRLPTATLADALGGFARDHDTIMPLVELLTVGQPLMEFNDGVHCLWPDGQRAQYQTLVEVSDGSVTDALVEACIQADLPAPLVERRVSEESTPRLELRMVQLVSGLTWFSEARRLRPMVEEHSAVMAEADQNGLTREGLRTALRDDAGSEALIELLPDQVLQGVDELRRLTRSAAEAAAEQEGVASPPPRIEPAVILDATPSSTDIAYDEAGALGA
jgi:hypothetical protein